MNAPIPPDVAGQEADQLFFDAPGQVSLRRALLPPPGPGEALVITRVSAISAGTERLFLRGEVPAGLAADAAIEALRQPVRYPLRYGYACAGIVAAVGGTVAAVGGIVAAVGGTVAAVGGGEPALGSDTDAGWIGQPVFAFEPHASRFVAPLAALQRVPPQVSLEHAALLPNMETAVTLLLDGAPLIGERVLVLGAGIVGLLVTALLARLPLADLTVVDSLPVRRARAVALGASRALAPDDATGLRDFDLVYELSGNPVALNRAIDAAGFESRIVVGSWYGSKQAPVDLGGHFHRSRMRILSSQVSTPGASWAPRWSKQRRLDLAWRWLAGLDREISTLITHRFPLARAPEAYALLDRPDGDVLQMLLTYDAPP